MQRKIIKQGQGGFTVSLPVNWVRAQHLQAGDNVHITEVQHNLLLSGKGREEKKATELTLSKASEPFMRILLHNCYRIGYDTITLNIQGKQQADLIEHLTEKYLLGFHITKKTEQQVILENIAEPSENKYETILRRMFLIIQESLQLVKEDLSKKKNTNREKLMSYKEQLNQYNSFCKRSIIKKQFNEERTHFYWGLYTYLLLIEHSILDFHQNNTKKTASKQVQKKLSEIQKLYTATYEAFYKKNKEALQQHHDAGKKLLQSIHKDLQNQGVSAYHLAELSRLTNILISPMMGILLD